MPERSHSKQENNIISYALTGKCNYAFWQEVKWLKHSKTVKHSVFNLD